MSKMKLSDAELVVWVDLETTGLDPKDGLPLEAGILVTDLELQPIAAMDSVIQWGTLDWDGKIDPFVRTMHEASGLRKEYDHGAGKDIHAVEQMLMRFLADQGATMLPMAGSNVANFDRKWLAEFMPGLNELFHYRNIDVSSIKEACRLWNPEVYAKLPPTIESHRTIQDCRDTVTEFSFYRDNFLWVTR